MAGGYGRVEDVLKNVPTGRGEFCAVGDLPDGSELAEFDHGSDALDDGVFAVFVGVVAGL